MKEFPSYLNEIADQNSKRFEEDALLIFDLAKGDVRQFEVFYVGEIEMFDDDPYILSNDDDVHKLFIRELGSDKLLTVYDSTIHGYDNMFCDEHEENEAEPIRLEVDGATLFSVHMTLGYSIDYDDEKEDYEVDEDGMLMVLNREEKISWEQVKEEGYDWIAVELISDKGKKIFLEKELA